VIAARRWQKLSGRTDDVRPLAGRGELQYRTMMAKPAFPVGALNLFAFPEEAKRRRPVVPTKRLKLTDHLARVFGIGRSRRRPTSCRSASRNLFITVDKARRREEGRDGRAWLPFAVVSQQSARLLVSTSPPDGKVGPEGTLSVAFILSTLINDGKAPRFEVVFEFRTHRLVPEAGHGNRRRSRPMRPIRPYLKRAGRPHAVFTRR